MPWKQENIMLYTLKKLELIILITAKAAQWQKQLDHL